MSLFQNVNPMMQSPYNMLINMGMNMNNNKMNLFYNIPPQNTSLNNIQGKNMNIENNINALENTLTTYTNINNANEKWK